MDIDYLKDIGKIDSFPLSIDSSKRNKLIYPRPAEYEIEFDTPFTNVVGIDVLDATIPNTMYIVDEHNCMLSFVVHVNSNPNSGRDVEVYFSDLATATDFIEVWDDTTYKKLRVKLCGTLLSIYQLDRPVTVVKNERRSTYENLRAFMLVLAEQEELVPDDVLKNLLEAALNDGSEIYGYTVRYATNNEVVSDWPIVVIDNDITLYPYPEQAVIDLGITTIPIDGGNMYEITYNDTEDKYYIKYYTSNVEDNFGDGIEIPTVDFGSGDSRFIVSAKETTALYGTQTRYASVRATTLMESPIGNKQRMHFPKILQNKLVEVSTYGLFRVSNEFYDQMTNDPKADPGNVDNPFDLKRTTFHHELEFHNLVLDLGNHDINSLVQAMRFAMPTYDPPDAVTQNAEQPILDIVSTSLINDDNNPNFTRQRRLRFESSFKFWMDMQKSTIKDVIGFSELAEDTRSEYDSYRIGQNKRVFKAIPKVLSSTSKLYVLETPGIMTLLGERMVVLRCPQIEDHAFPSLSHGEYSAGLGVFKLYDQKIAHLRFDFTKLTRLNFHPIGKLNKLRFRFERLNGELYNFKGVDHHLFMSVKFMVPRSDRTLPPPQNRLNPDYDPNIMRYQVTRKNELDESDTESDDELVRDRDHILRYYENRRKFMMQEEVRTRMTRTLEQQDTDSDVSLNSGLEF